MVLCSQGIMKGEMTVGDLVKYVLICLLVMKFVCSKRLTDGGQIMDKCHGTGHGEWTSLPIISSTEFSW
jgi:hypothetical protein